MPCATWGPAVYGEIGSGFNVATGHFFITLSFTAPVVNKACSYHLFRWQRISKTQKKIVRVVSVVISAILFR